MMRTISVIIGSLRAAYGELFSTRYDYITAFLGLVVCLLSLQLLSRSSPFGCCQTYDRSTESIGSGVLLFEFDHLF